MNHTYRLVWNEENQRYVPAPECACTRGKRSGGVLWSAVHALAAAFAPPRVAQAPAENALPSGGQVVAGQAGIRQSGNRMTVDQASSRAVIDWQGFDIGSQAAVHFNQPSAGAVALNRIVAGDASQIHGQLTATGQVWLVNPNGVIFGAGSRMSVGGLVASTMDITNADFMAGKAVFDRDGATGRIENHGQITAADGGLVALLAPTVKNDGIVSARLGKVVLAAGERIALDIDADGLLSVAIDPATVRTLIENRQLIVADGGEVVMTGRAANLLSASVVTNHGTVQARTMAEREGRILLLADMQHGKTEVGGTLDASAPDGGNGGFIETSAAKVGFDDAVLITTKAGKNGKNGRWLIDPGGFTIAASGGDMTGALLSSQLGEGDVEIQSSLGGTGGSGGIHVNDAVSWRANTLTLTAARDIDINAVMTASGTAALEMNTGTANGGDAGVDGGTVRVGLSEDGFTGRVDFPERSGTGFLSINGNDYTVIDSLGAQDSATGTDLQGMENDLAGHYALGSDIDASDTAGWEDGKGFAPVGPAGFTGTFDGLGHTIGKLTIDRPDQMFVGLFSGLGGDAALRNVGLAGGSVTGKELVGGLVGSDSWGTLIRIGNVFSTANVTGENYIGGLAGSIGTQETGALALNNAWAGGEVFGAGNAVGGLAGSISAYGGSITVDNAWAVGDVTGNDRVGGLVGVAELSGDDVHDESHVSISKVSASGKVTGHGSVGGLIGLSHNFGNDTSKLTLANAEAFGDVEGSDHGVGGLLGSNMADGDVAIAMSKVRASGKVTGTDQVGGLIGRSEGMGADVSISDARASGSVTGNGDVGGLVGYSVIRDDGTCSISKAWATGDVTGNYNVGGLVGQNESFGGNATASIDKAHATGAVTGTSGAVGGLVGKSHAWAGDATVSISNVYATGNVTTGSLFVGGLVGCANRTAISNAYATGAVRGVNFAGGLVGYAVEDVDVSASFWDTQSTGQTSSSGGGTGMTTAEMKTLANFSSATEANGNVDPGWDISANGGEPCVWRIYEGDTAPLLRD